MMKFKLFVFIVFIVIIGIASCKKGDDTIATPLTTRINFVNASTDTLNFYVNGTRLNRTAAAYPLSSTDYLFSPLGEQNYQVKKDRNPNVLFNLSLPLDTASIYSLYITGNTSESTFITKDSLNTLPDSVTSIRFVNTSPTVGDLDVMIIDTAKKVTEVVKFNARVYKSSSKFLAIKAGGKRIRIFKAGTTQLLSSEIRTLQSRSAYTLFTKNNLNTTSDTTSGTGLITNK